MHSNDLPAWVIPGGHFFDGDVYIYSRSFSQLPFLIYLLGLGTFAGQSIYSFSYSVEIILICIVCEVGVYL
jgi:hypothetical protein